MSELILLEDDSLISDSESSNIYLWNGYNEKGNVKSLMRYLETNGDRLRAKYMDFIHDLGEARVDGKRVVEVLAFDNSFSLWWMSLLAEKSPYKSPRILDCVRLLALEEVMVEHNTKKMILISNDLGVNESLKYLCQKKGITYKFELREKIRESSGLRKIYDCLPHQIQGLIYGLRYVVTRWVFTRNSIPDWHQGNDSVFFMSNFFHLDGKKTTQSTFYSKQWEKLPDFLNERGVKTNFIHHFLYSPEVPGTKLASRLIEQFNQHSKKNAHLILDSFLTLSLVIRVLNKWLRLLWRTRKIRNAVELFTPKDSQATFWYLLKEDWKSSLVGSAAVLNLFFAELFDRALATLPHQRLGLYLCENQGWERAFVHFWRKHSHGKVIGVAHSTIRFWDIRYFYSLSTLSSRDTYPLPRPDKTAVNGKQGWELLIESGISEKDLMEAEALRYQYLSGLETNMLKSSVATNVKSLLVIGDFTTERTAKMMEIVSLANQASKNKFSISLKPHPACKLELLSEYKFNLINEPIGKIARNFDYVFSSNTTSASLDVYLSGSPVLVFLDGNDFNFSPLREVKNVFFVSSGKDLLEGINRQGSGSLEAKVEDFFWLDEALPRWKKCFHEAGIRL